MITAKEANLKTRQCNNLDTTVKTFNHAFKLCTIAAKMGSMECYIDVDTNKADNISEELSNNGFTVWDKHLKQFEDQRLIAVSWDKKVANDGLAYSLKKLTKRARKNIINDYCDNILSGIIDKAISINHYSITIDNTCGDDLWFIFGLCKKLKNCGYEVTLLRSVVGFMIQVSWKRNNH